MAVSIDCFIGDLALDPAVGHELCALCSKHGILQAVDFASLRPAQLRIVLQGASDGTLAKADFVVTSAKNLSRGWAAGSVRRVERAVATERQSFISPPEPPVVECGARATSLREPTRQRIEGAVAAVTKGVLFGTECGNPVARGDIPTTVQMADAQMAKALRRAEEVFFKYASGSKRALALSGQASPEEWALHRRT